MRIEIDGYLLQRKLEAALIQIVGEDAWLGRELKVPNSRRRWDMAYQIGDQTTVVEFDGDAHYWNSLKIKVDKEKDGVASKLGYRVVRVPYWVQLTTETLAYYFGLKAEIEQDFPHGFIATKIFPASFSELGVGRFQRELSSLPSNVNEAVIASLKDRAQEHGDEYVVPSALQHLL
ncbi:hypothetical protein P1P91_12200 [Halomonas piscis]|uniref:DUF559 domain-containing protein n=1 Tax=Halomonas piscis TaxID=3031727 RepID=A0ABY9YXH2_9GAMM|nr:hypothetical protein [Halomonas piscis]WNK19590.1 hypothetical protein P1P91_12200 [Halomonas piscis]